MHRRKQLLLLLLLWSTPPFLHVQLPALIQLPLPAIRNVHPRAQHPKGARPEVPQAELQVGSLGLKEEEAGEEGEFSGGGVGGNGHGMGEESVGIREHRGECRRDSGYGRKVREEGCPTTTTGAAAAAAAATVPREKYGEGEGAGQWETTAPGALQGPPKREGERRRGRRGVRQQMRAWE